MKNIFGIAVATALLLTTPRAAEAELVVGFNFGETTPVVETPAVTIGQTKVIASTSNGAIDELADSASAPPVVVTRVTGGQTFTSFTGSFSSTQRLDLLTFDFAYESLNESAIFSVNIEADGQSRSDSGSLSGAGTFAKTFDFDDIVFVNTGSIELQLTDAVLIDDFGLPTSDHTGFAAISGQPTAIPEPSTVAGLALLSGVGLLVHRRRRVAKLG